MTDPSESVPASSGGVLDRPAADAATLTAPLPGAPLTPLAPESLEEVVVLDYGGQYSQLIARRIRDCGVFSEMLPHDVPLEEIARRKPRGIILSGGPASVYAPGAPRLELGLLELGVPVMGICYGMQLLMHELGGRVEQADVGEFGRSELHVGTPGVLLRETPREQTCWMSHRDTVFEPPQGFTALASSSCISGGRRGGLRAGYLRHPVSPRGGAHPIRPGDPDEVPDRRVRLRADVDGGLDRRGPGAAHSRAGWRRQRDLRAVGRGGFLGGGAARSSRCGGAADVRVRRSRADAQGRGRAGGERVSRHLQSAAGRR